MALLPSWWPLLQTTAWRPGGLLVRPRWVGEGAAELKVCVSSCNAGVNTADGKGREGETAEPYPSPPPGPPPPPIPCPVARWSSDHDHDMKAGLWYYYSSVPRSAWSTGRAKDPWIPQLCSGRKPHSLSQRSSASLQEFCTNHRTQKGESFIQNPAAAAALHLALFEELMETSQQVLSSRWVRDCLSGQLLHSTVTASLWKQPKPPHSSSLLSP